MASLFEGAGSFGQLMQSLENIGFFTGLLPFVITYAIFFFMLRKVSEQILDDKGRAKQFSAILSIAFAFFTSRFIVMNPAYQQFFTQYLGRFTVLMVGFLGLLVMLGWFGIELENMGTGIWGGIAALFIAALFVVSGGLNASLLPVQSQNQILNAVFGFLNWSLNTGVIFIILILGLLWWSMKDPSENGDEDSLLEKLFTQELGGDSDDDG